MTEVIAIAMVRNEADIIETWVRYHLAIVDRMVILDNGSADETPDIILAMIKEGLPVTYVFDGDPCYRQDVMTTGLLYAVMAAYKPKYVVPLDADEFIIEADGDQRNVRSTLLESVTLDSIQMIPWRGYVPTDREATGSSSLFRDIQHRRAAEPVPVHKVLLPTAIASNVRLILKQGNHDVVARDNSSIRRRILPSVALAHFPIRSIEQFKAKVVVGWLANMAKPGYVLFDWFTFYSLFAQRHAVGLKELTHLALRKDLESGDPSPSLLCDPIERNVPRMYPPNRAPCAFSDLLSYCEDLSSLVSCSSTVRGATESRTPEECEGSYLQQLQRQDLVTSFHQTGLRPAEAFAILEILGRLTLSADGGGVLAICGRPTGSIAECVAGFAASAGMRVVSHRTDGGSPYDVAFIGAATEYCPSRAMINDCVRMTRKDGWLLFHDIIGSSELREIVEKCISPAAEWVRKGLVKGLFVAQRAIG